MEDLPELWEHRISELLDNKLKPIQKKLLKLEKSLRIIAHIEILNVANDCRKSVRTKKPKTPDSFFEQLTAKLTLTLNKIDNSNDPISILADFNDWCIGEEEKLEIKFIKPPD